MSSERICPDCGAALPAAGPRGLCPPCLMASALSGRSGQESTGRGVLDTMTRRRMREAKRCGS
jgi:hypothetical protein